MATDVKVSVRKTDLVGSYHFALPTGRGEKMGLGEIYGTYVPYISPEFPSPRPSRGGAGGGVMIYARNCHHRYRSNFC
jgi:hypothetical protein